MSDIMCDNKEVHGPHEWSGYRGPHTCPGLAKVVFYNQFPDDFPKIESHPLPNMWDFLKPAVEDSIQFFYPEADIEFSMMLGEREIARWNSQQKPLPKKHPLPQAMRYRQENRAQSRRRRSDLSPRTIPRKHPDPLAQFATVPSKSLKTAVMKAFGIYSPGR